MPFQENSWYFLSVLLQQKLKINYSFKNELKQMQSLKA